MKPIFVRIQLGFTRIRRFLQLRRPGADTPERVVRLGERTEATRPWRTGEWLERNGRNGSQPAHTGNVGQVRGGGRPPAKLDPEFDGWAGMEAYRYDQ